MGLLARISSCTAALGKRRERLPELLRPLLWEYRREDPRLPADRDQVMLKLLTYGRPEHVDWLRNRHGDVDMRSWIAQRRGRGLRVAQMSRWVPEATARAWQTADPNSLIWEHR